MTTRTRKPTKPQATVAAKRTGATAAAKKGTATKAATTEGAAKTSAAKKTTAKKGAATTAAAKRPAAARTPMRKSTTGAPALLSGGNPQIAKGDGDAPVQAYIAAMPDWKREIGVWVDAVVSRAVPHVRKAVKWNSPFYGVEGKGWFLAFHCFDHYVKVTFFRGTALRPMPPGPSKTPDARYLDVREHDPRDDAQLSAWARQAAAIPGWIP